MPLNELYDRKKFNDIYEDAETFKDEWEDSLFYSNGLLKEATVNLTFGLLTANFGNTPIANKSETEFKNKVFATMFQFGPTYEKKLELQANLRALTLDDLTAGTKQVHDSAQAPEEMAKAGEELDYIGGQSITRIKKNKVDAYASLWDMLTPDVTNDYVEQFKKLFATFIVRDRNPYVSEEEQ